MQFVLAYDACVRILSPVFVCAYGFAFLALFFCWSALFFVTEKIERDGVRMVRFN